jgi:hypothetical protein
MRLLRNAAAASARQDNAVYDWLAMAGDDNVDFNELAHGDRKFFTLDRKLYNARMGVSKGNSMA